jgi:hypothetical protein
MISQNGTPPVPMPIQVPPGHVMQQIVDENGTLRHVILSTQHQQMQGNLQNIQQHLHGHFVSRESGKSISNFNGSDSSSERTIAFFYSNATSVKMYKKFL